MPRPRKRFAQHWLKDGAVHQKIIEAAQLGATPEQTTVLEIGPGTGQLTRRLLATGAQVVGVEVDRDLGQLLTKQFGEQPNFTLQVADILAGPLPPTPTVVVANIPYNITSPILRKVLGSPEAPVAQFERIVLLVQQEIAERLSAPPHNKVYGAMTVRTRYLADCEMICTVPPRAFKPAPKVNSAVIRLTPRPWPTAAQDPHWFSILIQQGFATRRKLLSNNLQSLVPKDTVTAALEALGLSPQSRAEELDVAQWVALSNQLLAQRQASLNKATPETLDPLVGEEYA